MRAASPALFRASIWCSVQYLLSTRKIRCQKESGEQEAVLGEADSLWVLPMGHLVLEV